MSDSWILLRLYLNIATDRAAESSCCVTAEGVKKPTCYNIDKPLTKTKKRTKKIESKYFNTQYILRLYKLLDIAFIVKS